jgi:hypothetical protein
MNVQTFPTAPVRAPYSLVSIRGYLMLLIGAIILPMLVLAGVLAWNYALAAQRTIEAERLDIANNLTDLIDREVGRLAGFLNGVAISSGFRSGDPEVVQEVMEVARARGFQTLGLFDRSGHPLFVAPSTPSVPFISAEQAGVGQIMAGKPLFVSDLQLLPNGSAGLFYVSVPIVVRGQVAFVVTGGVEPRLLQGLFAEAGLREEWGAGMVDSKGIFLARSRASAAYVGHPALQPMVDVVRGGKPEGFFDIISRSGTEVKNTYRRSAFTGWYVVVVVPAALVNAPFWSAMEILAAVGLVLTLVSLGLGILVARRISRDVNHLGHAVVAYASGDVVPLPAATLAELRDVLRVVEAAAAVDGNRAMLRRPGERI